MQQVSSYVTLDGHAALAAAPVTEHLLRGRPSATRNHHRVRVGVYRYRDIYSYCLRLRLGLLLGLGVRVSVFGMGRVNYYW